KIALSLDALHVEDARSVAISLEREAIDLVLDPLPHARRARVLVIDTDPSAAARLLALTSEFETTRAIDGWLALEAIAEHDFDLVFCALRIDEWRGMVLYRAAVSAKPSIASRFYFMATRHALDGAPASSAAGRMVAKPLDPAQVRRLVAAR